VSFSKRIAIEIVNAGETDVIERDRALRSEWLAQRGYRVVELPAEEIETRLPEMLAQIEAVAEAVTSRP
jgi:tRNA/rRNA methyltransferase